MTKLPVFLSSNSCEGKKREAREPESVTNYRKHIRQISERKQPQDRRRKDPSRKSKGQAAKISNRIWMRKQRN